MPLRPYGSKDSEDGDGGDDDHVSDDVCDEILMTSGHYCFPMLESIKTPDLLCYSPTKLHTSWPC